MRVGLISRRWKRFLLNERELGYALLDAGYDVRLLALEDMTLYEQVAALRATTVLVGVHGSGLNNALYLRPGAAVLQIVPFGLRYRGDFEGIATRNGVSYGELVLEDRRRSVFHWEFLDPERLVAGRAAVLDAGSPPGGREVYAFWVNQDVVVPRAAFLGAVRGAAASPLNRRLLARGKSTERVNASGRFGGRRRRRQRCFSFSAAKGASAPRRTPARTAGVQSRADRGRPPFHHDDEPARLRRRLLGLAGHERQRRVPRHVLGSQVVRRRQEVREAAPLFQTPRRDLEQVAEHVGRRVGFRRWHVLPPQSVRHRLDGPVLARAPRARAHAVRRVADHAVERPLNTRPPERVEEARAVHPENFRQRQAVLPEVREDGPPLLVVGVQRLQRRRTSFPLSRSVADQKTWLCGTASASRAPPSPASRGEPDQGACCLETADCCRRQHAGRDAQRPNSFTSSSCVISFSTSDGTRCILKRAGATACDDSINCFKPSCSRPRPRQYTRLAGSLRYVSVTYNDTNRDRETHQCGLERRARQPQLASCNILARHPNDALSYQSARRRCPCARTHSHAFGRAPSRCPSINPMDDLPATPIRSPRSPGKKLTLAEDEVARLRARLEEEEAWQAKILKRLEAKAAEEKKNESKYESTARALDDCAADLGVSTMRGLGR